MSYSKLLDRLITDSGMTAKDVAEKCKEKGQQITASYISILRKESKNRKASPELSKALEEILGVESDTLAVEAYLENAPKALINAIEVLRDVSIQPYIKELTEEQQNAFKDRITLSDIVIEMSKSSLEKVANSIEMNETKGVIEVKDNSMLPILQNGDKVQIEMKSNYKSGAIVLVANKKDTYCRKLHTDEKGNMYFAAQENGYPIIKADNNIKIIGEVVSFTRKL